MSSRSGKHKSKTFRPPNDWSEWVWDESHYQYYRARQGPNGEYEYEYTPGSPQAPAHTIPRSEASGSAVGRYATNSDGNNTGYAGNREYEYGSPQQSTQSSASVDALSSHFADVTITPRQKPVALSASSYPNPSSTGYEVSSSTYDSSSYSLSYKPTSVSNDTGSTQHAQTTSAPSTSYNTSSYGMPGSTYTGGYGYAGQTQYSSGISMTATPAVASSSYSSAPGSGYSTGYVAPSSGYQSQTDGGEGSSTGAITPKMSSNRVIQGATGNKESEKLKPNFKVHSSKYFQPGQIFKVLWSEPQGEGRTSETDVTEFTIGETKYGEKVYSSIRRFVIVRTGRGHSQCVPISTYQHQGTAKWGVNRNDHAIIYMGDNPPSELSGESQLEKIPIQVIPRTARDKLERDSRVNYAKLYTVEHNVKVSFIGHLASQSEGSFMMDFSRVQRNMTEMGG